jgi:hypothetical protein
MTLFRKWPFSAISASIGGIACTAYSSTPPRNSTDFLELAENCTFLDRKLINDLIKPWVDTEQLKTKGPQAESKGSHRPVFEPEFSTLGFEP